MPHFTIRKDKNTFSMNDQPEAKIIERHGGTIVVRCPGYREQHGRGLSSYKFSEYQVWQITEIEDLGEILQGNAEWVIDFPASPKLQGKHIVHSTSTVTAEMSTRKYQDMLANLIAERDKIFNQIALLNSEAERRHHFSMYRTSTNAEMIREVTAVVAQHGKWHLP